MNSLNRICLLLLLTLSIAALGVGCAEDKVTGDYSAHCVITSPANGASVPIGRYVTITAAGNKYTSSVEFYIDGKKVGIDMTPSNGFSYQFATGLSNVPVSIYAKAVDLMGGHQYSTNTNTVTPSYSGTALVSDGSVYVSTNPAWILRWEDNFNGTSINSSVWSFDEGYRGGGWGNDEWQYYVTNAFYVGEGALAINAVCPGGEPGKRTFTVFSGRMHTYNKFAFHYNNVEGNTGSAVKVMARIKAPYSRGYFPAFWMMGTNFDPSAGDYNWPACGEIDIFELTGGAKDNVSLCTLHWKNGGGSHQYIGSNYTHTAKLSDDYHIYEVEWSATQIIGRIDGITYFSKTFTGDMLDEFTNKDFFILINMALGGNLAGDLDGTTVFPMTMYVDWIRIYQKN